MYSPSLSILFLAVILLISTSAMPSPSVYPIENDQLNSNDGDVEVGEFIRRSLETTPWINRRNSPLCDYRLQFRPLPLTSALCAYR